jgi:hypothetical protein
MTEHERKKNVVGVLQLTELRTCIQALEKLEKEAQAIVDQTPDAALDERWEEWQGVAVHARNALTTFRAIVKSAEAINANPKTAYTIRWEGSLGQALDAWGVKFRDEGNPLDTL